MPPRPPPHQGMLLIPLTQQYNNMCIRCFVDAFGRTLLGTMRPRPHTKELPTVFRTFGPTWLGETAPAATHKGTLRNLKMDISTNDTACCLVPPWPTPPPLLSRENCKLVRTCSQPNTCANQLLVPLGARQAIAKDAYISLKNRI